MGLYESLVVIGIVLILAVICGIGVATLSAEKRCLAAGYPHSNVTYTLERYCIRRVDQTDIVVPLEKAERGNQ